MGRQGLEDLVHQSHVRRAEGDEPGRGVGATHVGVVPARRLDPLTQAGLQLGVGRDLEVDAVEEAGERGDVRHVISLNTPM